jgi:hypothetical protein
LSQIPPDIEMVPVSRTIGQGRVVDEMVARFIHTISMNWMLPGISPTGKRVEVGSDESAKGDSRAIADSNEGDRIARAVKRIRGGAKTARRGDSA